jgi:hypothetical protein
MKPKPRMVQHNGTWYIFDTHLGAEIISGQGDTPEQAWLEHITTRIELYNPLDNYSVNRISFLFTMIGLFGTVVTIGIFACAYFVGG